ncbi:MAG: hypothetical protein NUW37_03505 [Planctomycetes bacterium]|nr:hypothetical protein [Planctomycetota bacterium]
MPELFEITEVRVRTREELIAGLRSVTLKENSAVKIYRDCAISVERLDPRQFAPPQRYVLESQVKTLMHLDFELERHGVDMFDLEGFVEYRVDGSSDWNGLLPIIIEESIEANGEIKFIICDGMHRAYLAMSQMKLPKVAFIRGIPKEYPYYAYPNPNGWDDVAPISMKEEESGLGKSMIKKVHRIRNNKSLYRYFAPVFANLSEPRG